MLKQKKPYSLNLQIVQLQQQIVDERTLQQLQQQHFQQVLINRLTSWPLLLSAVVTGLVLHQISTPAKPLASQAPVTSPEASAIEIQSTTAPVAIWKKLLSAPLITEAIWWLFDYIWQKGLAQQRVVKSDLRQPRYDGNPL